jgi:hypothetical protein
LGKVIERKLQQTSKGANLRWSPKEQEDSATQSERLWKRRAETALGNQKAISLSHSRNNNKPSATFQMSRQHNLRLHS